MVNRKFIRYGLGVLTAGAVMGLGAVGADLIFDIYYHSEQSHGWYKAFPLTTEQAFAGGALLGMGISGITLPFSLKYEGD